MSGNLGAKKWSTSSSRIDSDAEMKEAQVTNERWTEWPDERSTYRFNSPTSNIKLFLTTSFKDCFGYKWCSDIQ